MLIARHYGEVEPGGTMLRKAANAMAAVAVAIVLSGCTAEEAPWQEFTISANICDKGSQNCFFAPVPNARIDITTEDGEPLYSGVTSENGIYRITPIETADAKIVVTWGSHRLTDSLFLDPSGYTSTGMMFPDIIKF